MFEDIRKQPRLLGLEDLLTQFQREVKYTAVSPLFSTPFPLELVVNL